MASSGEVAITVLALSTLTKCVAESTVAIKPARNARGILWSLEMAPQMTAAACWFGLSALGYCRNMVMEKGPCSLQK